MKTKKRTLSLFLAFAMILSLVPAATVPATASGDSYKVQLMARTGTGEWITNLYPYKSTTTLDLDGNTGTNEKHTLKIENIGEESLISLSLRAEGTSWCDWGDADDPDKRRCKGTGGMTDTDFFECPNCHVTWGDYLAPGYVDKDESGRFGQTVIRYTKVTINGNINALAKPVNVPLLSTHLEETGHASADLWNGWYKPAQRLTGIEQSPGNQSSFWLPNGNNIDSIEVEFEVLLVDGHYPEARKNRETNGVSVFLGAREALDWRSAGENFWKSDSLRITKDGTYDLNINFNHTSFEEPVDRLASLAIMSYGATFDESIGFLMNARKAPQSWIDESVLIGIKEVKINDNVIANTWGKNTEWGDKDIMLIPKDAGYEPTEEYVDVSLWNAWFPENRYLDTSATSKLFAIGPPARGAQGSRWYDADRGPLTRNFALGNIAGGADVYPLPNEAITSISVIFEISGINTQYCTVSGHSDVVLPCFKCDPTLCTGGCGQPATDCACPVCVNCQGPMPCQDCLPPPPPDCKNGRTGKACMLFTCSTICNKGNAWKVSGDTTGDGKVDIFDCLEILKFLIKMDCTITKGSANITIAQAEKASIISSQGLKDKKATIFCVLEILKFMIKMTSEVDGLHTVPKSQIPV
ncbi:MAG: hypothetical protein FWG33_00670 [Oscillospiraceae bacterium]|nr:hypothetical protein [Oscillospiraceae bacterium]